MRKIVVRGARVHNLDNVDIDIERDRLVVITGVSGSGKTSLAFDTIYAEGQRRYVESLSAYARQFLEKLARPDVDIIEGLSPAIAIRQQAAARSPRSTVATITEIHDYLRLLYARIGRVFCYRCKQEIRAHTVPDIVDWALALPPRTRYAVIAPFIRGVRGQLRAALDRLRKDGYIRVAIDGELTDLSAGIPQLDKNKRHSVDVYVDRLIAKDGIARRLTDSVELALALADGMVRIQPMSGGQAAETFSQRFSCLTCDISYPELEPRMFSFNSPHGACPSCSGLGWQQEFAAELVIADPGKSIAEGAIAPWSKRSVHQRILETVCKHYSIDTHAPFSSLTPAHRDIILDGGDDEIAFNVQKRRYKKPFEGVLKHLERRLADLEQKRASSADEADKHDAALSDLRSYMIESRCRECKGARLRVESRHVRVGDKGLVELSALALTDALDYLRGLSLGATERAIADKLLREIDARLGFLVGVGLGYLTLDRRVSTLSGGESQRIRLATQIGSSLVGVLYILDEPSIGLHPRDTHRLLQALLRLRDLGNTVIVVEHDADTIRAADQLVDMGPGAGVRGGKIVAAGSVAEVAACPDSLTGRYLAGTRAISTPRRRRPGTEKLILTGARTHNLKNVTAHIPLSRFTCVTGVSGSGKSSLIVDTLLPAVRRALGGRAAVGVDCDFESVRGAGALDRVIAIDQAAIGRTPRSNPATYTGVLPLIRDMFAQLPESKARGYKSGRYSFNVKGGRCETCRGEGALRIEMSFLPDVFVTCEVCAGRRYNRETLDIRYKGASIADVLDMSIEEALVFWRNVPRIRLRLEASRDVGLGYLTLGQAANTLSGGEAQRLKLARELAKKSSGRTLYVLDEPTTGLHFEDIRQLLAILDRLVDQGNTVVVIEHNIDVIKCADHIIDLGPDGGQDGGSIVATGTPEAITRAPGSHTGRFLGAALGGRQSPER